MRNMVKEKWIQIRATEDEKSRMDKQRRRENFSSVSEWLRKIALDRCKEDQKNGG